MSSDLSYIDRLVQRYERSGTSLFIRTYLKDTMELVNEFEFTGVVPGAPIPIEVQAVARNILSDIARLGPVVSPVGSSIDASGATMLVTASGSVPLPKRSGIPVITIIGDSIGSEYQSTACTAATYNSTTNIATLEFSGAINIKAGDVVNVTGMTDTGYDGFDLTVLSYSTSGGFFITYTPIGTPAGASSGGSVSYPWAIGNYIGILAWAKFLSGARFDFKQRAIGGSQIADTIARFDRDVPDANPNYVLLSIGTNDIYNADATVATLVSGLDTLKAKSENIGAQFGIITPPPQLNTRTSWSSAKLLKQFQFIAAAKTWGLSNGCHVFDSATSSAGTLNYINPADANGNYNTGFSLDKVHPSSLGAYALGKQIATWAQQWMPKRDFLMASVADASNLINGDFSGTGGSGADSGSVADSWTVSKSGASTVAASIAARTISADGDTCGNNQILAISGAASGASVTIAHSSVHASVANDDDLDVGMHLKVSSASDLKYIYVNTVTQTTTTGNRIQTYFTTGGSNAYPIPEDFSGVVELPSHVRGPNATHGNPSACTLSVVAVFGTSGTGAATISIGRGTLRVKN